MSILFFPRFILFCFSVLYLPLRLSILRLGDETVGENVHRQHGCETETDSYPCFRFVNVPIDTVNKRLTRESGEATAEIASLEKKLQYHETTNQKSRENLEQILKSGGRA